MSYKKYIRRNGKVFGPYVYHSRKVDGKVITEYQGKFKKKKNFIFWSLLSFFSVILLIGLSGTVTEIIQPQGAADLKLAPLTNTTFAVAYINASNSIAFFEVWNTSGTRIGGPFIVNATAIVPTYSRIDVVAINTTDLIFVYTNFSASRKNSSIILQGFNTAGTRTIIPINVENNVNLLNATTQVPRMSAVAASYFSVNNTVGIVYVNRSGDRLVMKRHNATTGLVVPVNTSVNPLLGNITYNLSNVIDFVTINTTAGVIFEYDSGGDNDTTFHVVSGGVEIVADTDIDANVGAWNISAIPRQPEVAIASMNNVSGKNLFALVWQNASGIRAAVRDEVGVAVAGTGTQTIVEDTLTSRPVATTVKNLQTNNDDFVVVWFNRSSTSIVAQVWNYTLNATTTQITVDANAAAAYINKFIAVVGDDEATPQQICTGTFVVAYTNSTNSTVFSSYWYNGSQWSGSCELPADVTAPSLNITTPAANDTIVRNTTVNYTASGGVASAWYSNDSYSVNLSLGSGGVFTNITNITWSQGVHSVRVYVNDTAGNLNESSITFTIDSVAPALNITGPVANATNTTDTGVDANFTIVDATTSIDSVWYSNDTFSVANYSLGSAGTWVNITNITWSQGIHTVRIYTNDTLNNVNYSTRTFTIDSFGPAINFTAPSLINGTYSRNAILVNITANDSSTLLTGINISLFDSNMAILNSSFSATSGTYSSFTLNFTGLSDGIYFVNASANDTVNNRNFSETRSYLLDTFGPAINFTTPTLTNGSYSRNAIHVNVTANDSTTLLTGINISLSNSAGDVINSSFSATAGTYSSFALNFTSLADGIYFLNASANDTINNRNFSETRSYLLDTTAPSLNITSPINKTNTSDIGTDVLFTRSDSGMGLDSCWYSNDTFSIANYSLGSGGVCANITNITWSQGTHNVRVYVNDTLGQVNQSHVLFVVDSFGPAINFTTPTLTNGSYSRNAIFANITANDSSTLLTGINISLFYGNGSILNSSFSATSGT
ncbi:MAG: hypothetical protein AABX93_00665, partial [Nanoarchaeota archaeon]